MSFIPKAKGHTAGKGTCARRGRWLMTQEPRRPHHALQPRVGKNVRPPEGSAAPTAPRKRSCGPFQKEPRPARRPCSCGEAVSRLAARAQQHFLPGAGPMRELQYPEGHALSGSGVHLSEVQEEGLLRTANRPGAGLPARSRRPSERLSARFPRRGPARAPAGPGRADGRSARGRCVSTAGAGLGSGTPRPASPASGRPCRGPRAGRSAVGARPAWRRPRGGAGPR